MAPPKVLAQLFEVGVEGLDTARKQWDAWHAGAGIKDLAELKRREDRWRPVATAIAGWIDLARQARAGGEDIPRIKEAEKWLKDASADIRNQRFAPIADQAMATWEHLRQQSNVTLALVHTTDLPLTSSAASCPAIVERRSRRHSSAPSAARCWRPARHTISWTTHWRKAAS